MLDILIKDGWLVDGGGKPAWRGDLGIKDGLIRCLGTNISAPAAKVIEVSGKVVAPGFIDLHCHSDLNYLNDQTGEIKLQQGVTTEIFGNCGFSAAPISRPSLSLLQAYSEPIMGQLRGDWTWQSYGEYLGRLQQKSYGPNIGGYVGNGALRIAVKGFAAGPLTQAELEQVQRLLRESLAAGALGLSLGLMYVPENYYSLDELVAICSVLREYHGLLTTHIRGEGNSLVRSVQEVLTLAERAEVPLHISHLKAAGKNNWGRQCEAAIALIEKARSKGLDVTCDVYPYTAGSSTLATLLPPWVLEGGIAKAIQRVQDPLKRRQIVTELNNEALTWDNLVYSTGWDSVVVSSVKTTANQPSIGKSIAEIAARRHETAVETALNLLVEEDGNVTIVFFHMSEADVIRIMKLDYALIISDSLYSTGGMPHPRLYGTFPRVFAKYVREQKVLSLETAVRKVTALSAQRLGLQSIGKLACGYRADVTIFDLAAIQDCATYTQPKQFPTGIEYVLVGGAIVNQFGQLLPPRNGQVFIKK